MRQRSDGGGGAVIAAVGSVVGGGSLVRFSRFIIPQTLLEDRNVNPSSLACVALIILAATAVLYAAEPAATAPSAGGTRTTPSGLKIIEVKAATDDGARKGDTVWVHYTGRLEDGKKFDSSLDRGQPIEFGLGSGQVIKGWDEGIAGMKIGEKRQLIIPPQLGYGSKGAGGVIPPDATLIFDVELVGFRRS